MYVFKDINRTSTVIEQNVVNYNHTFTTSSTGIQTKHIVSGSISSSYWNSLNVLFYTSGSPTYPNEHNFGKLSTSTLLLPRIQGKQYLNKFHGYPSSSIISIAQKFYGERIKEKSFVLTNKSFTDINGVNPVIKDDGYGNLYSLNAHHSQSAASSISSSDNYVGNIFYEHGIVVISETGSWSGSVNYSDIGKDFTLNIDSYDKLTTHEYSITLKPHEFNKSMNYTLRMPLSGTFSTINEFTSSVFSNPYLAADFTSSNFTPYITTINLYQKGDGDTPVIVAKLPYPIRKSNKVTTTFKIKLDM